MKKFILAVIAVSILGYSSPVSAQETLPKGTISVDECKIKENSRIRKPSDPTPDYTNEVEIRGRYRGNATAFPFAPTALQVKGEINVALVFVDWADLPGTKKDYDFYNAQVKLFKDFYWMVSENTLKMNITVSPKWFRIPGSYTTYKTTAAEEAQRGEAPKKQVFYDAAIAASDTETDFSNIDLVFFAVPTARSVFEGGPHEFNFDYNGYLKTAEKNIYDTATAGDFFLKHKGQPPWVYYVHETGHIIGIPHQANEDMNKPRVEKYVVTPLGGWDIMSNQGGATRTMTAWLRWLAGWLNDSQVICTSPEVITTNDFVLTPINRIRGKSKALVIKLSETKVVVVESRRHDSRFDIATGNNKNGLLVYTVDATLAAAQGNQVILSPRNIKTYIKEKNTFPDWRELDGILRQGNSVKIGKLIIRAQSIGKYTDVVRVTKSK